MKEGVRDAEFIYNEFGIIYDEFYYIVTTVGETFLRILVLFHRVYSACGFGYQCTSENVCYIWCVCVCVSNTTTQDKYQNRRKEKIVCFETPIPM